MLIVQLSIIATQNRMKNACKIFLFVILLVASIAAGSYMYQLISHRPTGFIISNEIAREDQVRHLEGYDAYFLDDIQGVVLSVEKLGLPPVGSRHSNSGQRLRITTQSIDGTIFIIDDIYSGKQAEAQIESMVGEFLTPDKLWMMRSSIGWD